jgi:cytochrome d ubiquinol oxidase subunit II
MELPVLFAAFAALTIAVYVVTDGFDLGVGILFVLAPDDADRDVMMESIEPVWDGNETWLVMGGTFLFAAFPSAYYILLPAFYVPVLTMLFGLIGRGVAVGFRGHALRFRRLWDWVFAGGSLLAVLSQGFILGGFVSGVPVSDGMFAGHSLDAFTTFGLLCGIGLVSGYALLGAGWLIWKSSGTTQVFARQAGRAALIVVVVMMSVVSAWTALADPAVARRWFTWPNIAWLAPVPAVTALTIIASWRSLSGSNEVRTFQLAIVMFLLGFGGLIVSLWPYIVPRAFTVWDGVADRSTLAFVGPGILLVMPIVLAYQAHAYWVFRGKVRIADTSATTQSAKPYQASASTRLTGSTLG